MALLLLVLLAACGGGGGEEKVGPPPNVVPEGPSAWTAITVRAADGGREAAVPADLMTKAAPLLTGQMFDAEEPPSAYGLDAPRAKLVYEGAGRRHTVVVVVGGQNFDGRGYYVQREGDPRVFLVPADQLGPLLALVGL